MLWPLSGLGIEALPFWIVVIVVAFEVGIRLAVIGIIPGNRRPNTAMAWLLAIFFMPLVALPLFLLIGSNKLSARRQERQRRINEALLEATSHMDLSDQLRGDDEQLGATAALNRNLGAFPLQEGNHVTLIPGYKDYFTRVAAEIDAAEEYVHVVFYIVGEDPEYVGPVLDALERAAARGVTVRFLYDHLGTMRVRGYRRLKRRLTAASQQWPHFQWYRVLPIQPLRRRFSRLDLRNHRKIVVVDSRVAFTGSANLIEPHYQRRSAVRMNRRWVELNAKLTGPVVTGLDIVFASDWYAETGENLGTELLVDLEEDESARGGSLAQVVPSGPGFPDENNLRLFNDLIYQAVDRLVIVTPYLVPDDSLLYAVTNAAHREVEVTLLVTKKADQFTVQHAQQSYYQALLEAGVRIFRYPEPDVLHAKFMIVDHDVAVLGSSNMDMRSFSLNLEVTLMVVDDAKVAELHGIFLDYLSISEELNQEQWARRPLGTKYLDNVFRLTSALQ
ncbi:cardiolipin synthase [Nesterenkonia alkaliphila]|uniref:Cardiolipin synthase n=1 Tax=Nesterenkonia alkaliphila TaxID=1463631 RepID=A0A7K1UJ95_9MICC|nr:cardiolipin synthase [Nesterenkonia alkaliphila]MVT26539.1 cardiolipin synthase [Nesterenkonia alkaliphila]GFZ79059.1 cardiolipin synthase [Nesterenkonia alkaliphila]